MTAEVESFALMLRQLREPLLLASDGGQIVAANAAAAEALGTTVEGLAGTALDAFAPLPESVGASLKSSSPLPLRARDGRRFFCDAKTLAPGLLLLRLSGGPEPEPRERTFFDSLSRLDGLGRGESSLEILQAFTGTLAAAVTPADTSEAVVDMAMTAMSARSGGLWLLTDDGKALTLVRSVLGKNGPRPEHFTRVPLDRPSRMPILDAVRTVTPIWVESCAQMKDEYPDVFSAFSDGSDAALACLPLLAQGRCLGGLTFNFAGARKFGSEEKAFLQQLAWHSAQALERTRLYSAEKETRHAAEALALENARLYREARDADRAKDEFLAMLGHELRNPLAPIVIALGLMERHGGEAVARERALLGRHVQHLVRLVDDLLDVARITTGKIQLQKTRCDVSQLVTEAVEMTHALVTDRAHHLDVSLPAVPLYVVGDRARLTQTIANLLTNAAKYTEPGGQISITLQAEAGEAVLSVKDTGVGIAPEVLPKVFDLFVQATGALDRARGGLGIGLTVVKNVVTLHGGTVSAHSEGEGRGSELVLRLPLAAQDPATDAAPALDRPHAEAPAGAPLRVLVVDDNRDVAEMISEAFGELGCTTSLAYDGEAALTAAAEFRPDLAVLDIGLPKMDGYELAKRLRDSAKPTRLVALTGYGQESDRLRAREAGFDEHLVKPVDLDVLEGVVDRCREALGPGE